MFDRELTDRDRVALTVLRERVEGAIEDAYEAFIPAEVRAVVLDIVSQMQDEEDGR